MLREQRLTNAQIADEVGLAPGTVKDYASKLIQSGETESRQPRTKEESLQQVKKLRGQGKTHAKIAEELGITPDTAAKYASELVQSGELPRKVRSKLPVERIKELSNKV